MKKFRIIFEPMMFTNDYPKKTVEIACKKPNIKGLIKELYNRDIKNLTKRTNSNYLADDIIVSIEKKDA